MKKKYDLQKIKVGHTGTLDPLATGLLIICTGDKTKTINSFINLDKTYIGTLKLGAITDSFDSETKEKDIKEYNFITNSQILKSFSNFIGELSQVPPIFSAIKKNGKRLYEYARKNEKVLIPEREIHIRKLEFDIENFPEIKFIVECSKGTYIRSLIHDIGKSLNSGAHLKSLCREKIGDYSLKDAMSIDYFEKILKRKH